MDRFERKEYKYKVPLELMGRLRERVLVHMVHDSYCLDRENNSYPVHSIYFDTRRLLFYYEKISGTKLRKKLRIRAYDKSGPDGPAFLEIKRKINKTILKERAKVLLAETPNLTNGAQLNLYKDANRNQRQTLDKFIYLVKQLALEPKALIVYDREAFLGIDDPELRVTFDLNVSSLSSPSVEEIFRSDNLRPFSQEWFILEVKFFGQMPIWIRSIIRDFKFRLQSLSKYCNGLELWPDQQGIKGS